MTIHGNCKLSSEHSDASNNRYRYIKAAFQAKNLRSRVSQYLQAILSHVPTLPLRYERFKMY